MLALFLVFVVSVANATPGPCVKTGAGGRSYCTYNSTLDAVYCFVGPSGAASVGWGGGGTAWNVLIDDAGSGYFVCSASDFAAGAQNGVAYFRTDATGKTGPVDVDATAVGYPAQFYGSNGDDSFLGGDFTNLAYGKGGKDYIIGGDGDDTLYGGGGSDWVDGESDWLNESDDTLYAGDYADDPGGGCLNILKGERGDDTLYGSADATCGALGSADYLDGGYQGNNTIFGYAGNDILCTQGTPSNDHLDGGDGDDYIYGAGPTDVVVGGNGTDSCQAGAGSCESPGTVPNSYGCYATPTWP